MTKDEIQDNESYSIIEHFAETNQFISQALGASSVNKVLVHCAAGVSRSGAFTAAYMIGVGKLSFDEAIRNG